MLQDVNDYKVRLPLIKSVKADSTTWVSKYARGGSARKESSRRMYIAVDSVIGHISANGWVARGDGRSGSGGHLGGCLHAVRRWVARAGVGDGMACVCWRCGVCSSSARGVGECCVRSCSGTVTGACGVGRTRKGTKGGPRGHTHSRALTAGCRHGRLPSGAWSLVPVLVMYVDTGRYHTGHLANT